MKDASLLITAPYSYSGGVHSFVQSIHPFFRSETALFFRGRKSGRNSGPARVLAAALLPFRFLFQLLSFRPSHVLVNSSLSKECLMRDGLLVIISKMMRKKVVLIIHGFRETALQHSLLLKGFFKADVICVLAKRFADLIRGLGFRGPVHTQFNPVSLEILEDLRREAVSGRFDERMKTILFLGRVEESKGIFTAIEAFALACRQLPEISLKIAGTGTALQKAVRYVQERDLRNIDFTGFVEGKTKTQLLVDSDVFIFPTEHDEGLPISLLEAVAAGLVILTRPVAGIIDLFEKTRFGMMTDSTDPAVFAEAIVRIMENPSAYVSIRKSNAAFARNNFHPERIAKKIEAIVDVLG